MTELKQNSTEIENSINQSVTDYVECRIGVGDFIKRIIVFEESVDILIKDKKKYVAAIDIVIDNLEFELTSETYNPRDPNTTEKYIDWYYQKYVKNNLKL